MMKKYSFQINLIITILIMIFIFMQSALPADVSDEESRVIVDFLANIIHRDTDTISLVVRKIAHFTEYLILGIFLKLDVSGIIHLVQTKNNIISLLIGAFYAVSDEVHQSFVPGRSCELRDMIIDTFGVIVGIIIISILRRIREGK